MMIFMKILYKSGSRLREKFYYDVEARYKVLTLMPKLLEISQMFLPSGNKFKASNLNSSLYFSALDII